MASGLRELREAIMQREIAGQDAEVAREKQRSAERREREATRDIWRAIRRLRAELDIKAADVARACNIRPADYVDLEDGNSAWGDYAEVAKWLEERAKPVEVDHA